MTETVEAVGAEEAAPLAGRKEWLGLAVLALPCLLYSMDLSVLYLAVPSLTRDLAPTATQLLWISDVYGFLVAGFLITMGTLGDRIGRRRLLMIGGAAFGAGSLLAAFAPTAELLIAARALLGVAGATLAPSTLSLIRNMFHDERQRTVAISVWGTSYAVGGAIGPLVGGTLLHFFWWGSVFLPNVPVMALLLILGPRLLPEFRDRNAGRLDLASAAMSLAAAVAAIGGLKVIAEDGLAAGPLVAITAGLALGAVFAWRQTRLADPLIDLRLFRSSRFSVSVLTNGLGGFFAFGTFLYLAQYLQLVAGLTPLQAGLWMLPSSVAVIGGSLLAPRVVRLVQPSAAVAGGLAIAGVGIGLFTQVDAGAGLAVPVAASVLFALGLGPVFVFTTDLIVGSAPPERAGAAASISETAAEFGGAMGIAILGSIGTAVYRSDLEGSLPGGLPAAVAETAKDTLGGALAAAQTLPAQLGDALTSAAREAFTSGMRASTAIAAVVAVVIAGVAGTVLRRAD